VCLFHFLLGDWTQTLTFAWYVLYLLSHTSTLFCFSCFSGRHVFCPGTATDYNPSAYGLLGGWNHSYIPLHPACWLRWGLSHFLPRLAFNYDPLDLHLLSGWDYWLDPLYPAEVFVFYSGSLVNLHMHTLKFIELYSAVLFYLNCLPFSVSLFIKVFSFFFFILLYWGILWHLQKCLQYILVNSPPSSYYSLN
jgi:hypothetical protein